MRRGFAGRVAIAIEPALIALCFAFLCLWIGQHGARVVQTGGIKEIVDDRILAVVFLPGVVGFALYAVYLLVEPMRAMRETFGPIFIVDGYLQTRGRDDFSDRSSTGYIAVLLPDRQVACEWPTRGEADLTFALTPALVEFSEYGGVHTIDGRPTDVLPRHFRNIGVGASRRPAAR